MAKKNGILYRLFVGCVTLICCTAVFLGLRWVNETMTIRYQAVGLVSDADGAAIKNVEAVLLLSPPPTTGAQLDALFLNEAVTHLRASQDGEIKRKIGPAIGLSDRQGIFILRATGRTGASRAIRFGLDDSNRPPFEMAWLVVRKKGYATLTKTVSILGWHSAPKGWGTHANRLPKVIMTREAEQ